MKSSWDDQPGRSARGFNIVELMVVLAIAAIMITVATPSFRGLLRGFRITSAANDLLAAVNLTRAEAIARGSRVDLVPKNADWAKGWIIFIDKDGDQIPDDGEHIIFSHDPLPLGMEVTSNFEVANADAAKYVSYNATGHSRSNSGPQATRPGSWLLKLDGQSRKIVINFLGRARVCNPAADSGCDDPTQSGS